MKLFVAAAFTSGASAAIQVASKNISRSQLVPVSLVDVKSEGRVHFGDTNCPCIGFDNIDGETTVELKGKSGQVSTVAYPADLGARCEAWDNGKHPLCRAGEENDKWCSQKWCFVDPCTCSIDVLPKISDYVPEATYRGKPLFWSYATCGGKDMYSVDLPAVGSPGCRCIGFAGLPGTTEVTFANGKMVEYPASIGGECKAWDHQKHPECHGKNQPSWCKANWCYVDPCSCKLPGGAVPKISAYLPEATFTGKNLYYSYETCKSPDTWTEKGNPGACVNQDTKEACSKNHRCAWNGERCLGTELLNHPLCVKEEKEEPKEAKSFAAALAGSTPLLMMIALTAATAA